MSEPYLTPKGVEAAIKDAAKNAVETDDSLDVNRRIQLEYFDRFLSRVFSEGEGSEWLLKGGTSMLVRIPSSRATQDIDLTRCGFTLNQALDDLIRLSKINLNDHFSFEFASHSESVSTDNQPYTEGYAVKFNIYIGGASKSVLKVDLVVGSTVTGEVTTRKPASSRRAGPNSAPTRDCWVWQISPSRCRARWEPRGCAPKSFAPAPGRSTAAE